MSCRGWAVVDKGQVPEAGYWRASARELDNIVVTHMNGGGVKGDFAPGVTELPYREERVGA